MIDFLIYIKSNVFLRKPGNDGDVCRGLLSIIIHKIKRAIHNYNTPDHDVQAHNSIKEKTVTNRGIVAFINPCVEMYFRGYLGE